MATNNKYSTPITDITYEPLNPSNLAPDYAKVLTNALASNMFTPQSKKEQALKDSAYNKIYKTLYDKIYSITPDKNVNYKSIYNNSVISDALQNAQNNSNYWSSIGGATANRIDITPMINAFNQAAESSKASQLADRDIKRADLLATIERLREDTAESRRQQRLAYNATRADLEEQAYMANRSAMQSAAARGLGGSGLQQLAQLQNLIQTSQATNTAAQSNVSAQSELTKNLQRGEQDYSTDVANVETNYLNAIKAIDANLANQIANAYYNEETRYQNALQSAQQFNAQLQAQKLAASDTYKNIDNALSAIDAYMNYGLNSLKTAYNSSSKKSKRNKAVQEAYDTTLKDIESIIGESSLTAAQRNAIRQQWESYYNQFYTK